MVDPTHMLEDVSVSQIWAWKEIFLQIGKVLCIPCSLLQCGDHLGIFYVIGFLLLCSLSRHW